ncbi:MAG: sugar phosphate isomerase/epimerase [Candidatus Hydrogenedentes bacterium]|nr:sugar phosphate isomerase/epimerase [Candidatus Hydrogenedentota bacterium]
MVSSISRKEFLIRASGSVALAASSASFAAEQLAATWQIGCYLRPWNQFEHTVALDAIAEAGFKYTGLLTTKSPNKFGITVNTTPEEAAAIGEECKEHGLGLPSAYGGDIPLDSIEAGIAGMRKLIDNCATAGVANLMMGGVGTPELGEVYYKAIGESCAYAAEKGIGISVKPHGGTNATGPQCRALIEKVNQKNFRLWYDPGNIFFYSDGKLNPVDDAATVDGLVVGMSVKDYREPKTVDVTPGTGMVDFPKVLARLKRGGFTSGPLIVECLKPGTQAELLEEAKKAFAFVTNLIASPGST